MENIIILGAGPAGLTAAIYLARSGLNPLLLTGNLPGGLLTQTTQIENFPAFPDGILGFDLMEKMQQQAEKFGTRIQFATAAKVDFSDPEEKIVILEDETRLAARAVILALGAKPRTLGVPGEAKFQGKGVSYCATCDGPFFRNVPVVVVGGGDSALEEALFLSRTASAVHVIHRRDQFRASKIMSDRVLSNPAIQVHWNQTVQEIHGSDQGKVNRITLKDTISGQLMELPCNGVFIAAGHLPGTELLEGILPLVNGYIAVEGATSRTAIPGVFAAGDCADPHYRQAITAAAAGCKAALDAEKWLNEKE